MPRPILATVHPSALRHNLHRLRAAAPHARLWAVVKANAYGHGIERAYEGLCGADGFALLDLDEARRVRALGWRGPILLLEGCFDARDLEWCSRLQLWHVIHSEHQIDWLATHKTQTPHQVFLKLNTGMNRLGFRPDAWRAAWARLQALPQVDGVTLMTHFSDADASSAHSHLDTQQSCFDRVATDLGAEHSLCNSAAALAHARHPAQLARDWIRPGIALYGSSPDAPQHSAQDWGLAPAMTLSSELIAIQDLAAGEAVGYGGLYTAPHPMRIGIVACGYADGYPRHAPADNAAGTPVLVDGVRTRTVGRVSMDMLAVDLSPLDAQGRSCAPGTEVVLWGRSPSGAVLSVDEVAQACGTIGYELLCAVANRVPFQVSALT